MLLLTQRPQTDAEVSAAEMKEQVRLQFGGWLIPEIGLSIMHVSVWEGDGARDNLFTSEASSVLRSGSGP